MKYCQMLTFQPGGKLDAQKMVEIAEQAYSVHGFRGFVNWNHEVEPMKHKDVIYPVAFKLRTLVPWARFALFSDAKLIPADLTELGIFERIHVYNTNRVDRDFEVLRPLVSELVIDDEFDIPRTYHKGPCVRPYSEFIVNADGNVYMCGLCFSDGCAGNVFEDTLDEIIARFGLLREQVAVDDMTEMAPESCRECTMRTPRLIDYEKGVTIWEAQQHRILVDMMPREPLPPVVLIDAWKAPDFRVQEHVNWNMPVYAKNTERVILLIDREIDLGSCPVPYCDIMPLSPNFELKARRLNHGLNMARAYDATVVLKTTIDTVIPEDFYDCVRRLRRGEVALPFMLRAQGYTARKEVFSPQSVQRETIAMHWPPTLKYKKDALDPDSQLLAQVELLPLTVRPKGHIFHIVRKPQGRI